MGTHKWSLKELSVKMEDFYITLNNGSKMPRLGLGTWKAPAEQTKTAVVTAVKAGYRLIDCANDYDNEHVIGEALQELFKEGVVTREDLFIQAKLWNGNHRPEHVKPDLMKTLEDLQLDYVDSFVIHWPQAVPSTGKNPTLRPNGCYPAHHSKDTMFPLTDEGYYSADMESHYVETWEAMEKLVDEGLTKTIGLSNFNRRQVEEVLVSAKKYKPAVLQNESHPYLHEKDLRDYCRIHKIAFQAYSSLGSADRPWRIEENFKIWDFKLTDEDMKAFDEMNVGWRHLIWAECSMHPDFPFKDDLPWDYVLQKPGLGSTAG